MAALRFKKRSGRREALLREREEEREKASEREGERERFY